MDDNRYDGFYGHGESPKYDSGDDSFDERARAKAILNEYNLGIKGRTTPSESDDPAIKEMDTMISVYKERRKKQTADLDHVLNRLNETPYQRYRRIHNSDIFGRPYDKMPDARRYTMLFPKAVMLMLIMLGMMVLLLKACVFGAVRASETQKLIDAYTPVQGTAYVEYASVQRYGRSRYVKLSYAYEYEGQTYKGRQTLDEGQSKKAGLSNVFSNHEYPVTVYVNPEKPSSSLLAADAYPSVFMWLLIPVCIVMIIYPALWLARNFERGK